MRNIVVCDLRDGGTGGIGDPQLLAIVSENETEQAAWRAMVNDEVRRRRVAARSDVQKGAVASALWGSALLIGGLFQLFDAAE